MFFKQLLIVLVRIVVGALFAYSGWNKLIAPIQEFEYVIEQYQVFPTLMVHAIALILPWIELIFGVFLLLGFMRIFSARVLSCLCVGFLLLLSFTLLRGLHIAHCGCFGKGVQLTLPQALTFDSCLILVLAFFSVFPLQFFELDHWLGKKKS